MFIFKKVIDAMSFFSKQKPVKTSSQQTKPSKSPQRTSRQSSPPKSVQMLHFMKMELDSVSKRTAEIPAVLDQVGQIKSYIFDLVDQLNSGEAADQVDPIEQLSEQLEKIAENQIGMMESINRNTDRLAELIEEFNSLTQAAREAS
tara:strand:+ start:103 stop:540 length:438 start_codon:yes stop_codon:yes gene_type:complete